MFENNIVEYRFIQDLHFFVTGGDDENELALAAVLQGFYDAVTLLLRLLSNCLLLLIVKVVKNVDYITISSY